MIKNIAEYPVKVIMNEIGANLSEMIPEYQRLYVWKKDRQSKFIRHILYGFPTHKVFIDNREECWSILDGQQRITTLYNFINNDFSLDTQGKDELSTKCWNGKFFKDLDKNFQKQIMNYTLSCEMITLADSWEIEGLFDGLNSGMPLGKITEILLKDIKIKETLNEIKQFPFLSKIVESMSNNDRQKQEDDLLALRIICIFSKGIIGLDGDSLEEILISKELHNSLTDTMKRIKDTSLKLDDLYNREFFGGRKLIAYHSIPIFMLYSETREKEVVNRVYNRIVNDEALKTNFKDMNRSSTASKSKQEQRMGFFTKEELVHE